MRYLPGRMPGNSQFWHRIGQKIIILARINPDRVDVKFPDGFIGRVSPKSTKSIWKGGKHV